MNPFPKRMRDNLHVKAPVVVVMVIGSGYGDKSTRFMGLVLRHSETKQQTVFCNGNRCRNDAASVGSGPKTHLSGMRKRTMRPFLKRMRDNLHVKAPVAMLKSRNHFRISTGKCKKM
jgi:hypothetical protein